MSDNNDQSNRSKSPSKTPTSTLKRQSSRILGKPSQTSLNSTFTKDDPSSKLVEPPSKSLDDSQETPEKKKQQKKSITSDSWSLWPRRASQFVDDSSGPNTTTTNINTPTNTNTSAASIKSTKSTHSESLQVPPSGVNNVSDTESIKSGGAIYSTGNIITSKEDQKDEQQSDRNWMSWRKPSFTSLKRASLSTPSSEVIESDVSKSYADGNNKISNPPGSKSERATSWSFWNSSSSSSANNTANDKKQSLSNVLLGDDAVLFEPSEVTEQDKKAATSSKKTKLPLIPNKVVPVFESLPYYSTTASLINNFNNFKYTLGFDVENPKHLYRVSNNSQNIKRVLIIGVHGFFPTKVLRPLIGEPTGTSIKFAKEAEKAVLRWAKRENMEITIQKIALEKEGKIFDRVEFFYQVMKKWEKDIQNADFIYIASHSQGCPVSILLLSRLIEDGIINLDITKKISLLGMAGINNGPYYGVDQKLFVRAYSTIENDSLMELFQFQNFESIHSKEFLDSLKKIVSNNVKITFVGSINDQLVPLYSSTCLHVRHPNIFRATYIDGGSNTPDFVTRAVSLSNHLHNIGLSDHGVIKEISNSLAGPLTGGGHSKIYNDPQVYDLGLNFSIYTNDLKYKIPLHFKPYSIEQLGVNPYHLPWCMRGLLFESKVHIPQGDEEIDKLFEEFENWKPETKQLKDMKYRLNGIKSKL